RGRPWSDYAYLVHHRRAELESSEGDGVAGVLGRKRETEHRDADRRFFRIEPGAIRDLSVRVSSVLARKEPQLLFRDALQKIGAADGNERGERKSRGAVFEHRLSKCSIAAGGCQLLPRAIPPGGSVRAGYRTGEREESGREK